MTSQPRIDARPTGAATPRARGGADEGPEHALLSRRRRDTTVALILTLLTVLIFVVMA